MGKVICPRHGGIVGLLACQHISAAAWNEDQIPRSVRIFLEAEGEKLSAHLCEACSQTHGLAADTVIAFERGLNVYPVCPKCFSKE
jgi:hypothetical protein